MTRQLNKMNAAGFNVSILSTIENVKKFNLNELQNKEVEITIKNGTKLEGVVRDITDENEIILAKNGDWDNRITIPTNEIKDLDCSEHPYYSDGHKRRLREQKKPMFEFRYTEEQLAELVGKYASVNYDGKLIEGKIIKSKFVKSGFNEIIVECFSGEINSIQDYKIRDLEITGSSYPEHQGFKRLRDLEEELIFILEEYNEGHPEGPECRVQDPDILIEKYFESRMNGSDRNFDYNWCHEVMDKKEEYKDEEKSFLDDFRKAKDLNTYYECRKKFVDDSIKKIKNIDWTPYTRSQEEGITNAIKYIYESGIAVMLINEE